MPASPDRRGVAMIRRFLRIFEVCVVGLQLVAVSAGAWWDGGHMVVAEVALKHLDPSARRQAEELVKTFAEFYPNHSTFLTAATWMDYVRQQGGLSGFDSWHYTDIPYDPDSVLSDCQKQKLVGASEASDVRGAIKSAVTTLTRDRSSRFEKAFMLYVLLHTVGDIHMPCHTCSRFTKELPEGDQGANLFKAGPDGDVNLHQFWDSGLGSLPFPKSPPTSEDIAKVESVALALMKQYPPEHFPAMNELNPDLWAQEGYDIAVHDVYALKEFQPISKEYIENGQRISQERLTLAGYRLAALLNKIFATPSP